MNKYRILADDNQWRYFTVEVRDNRIMTVLLNEKGAQELNPQLKLRADTLGRYLEHYQLYEGDIIDCEIEDIDMAPVALRGVIVEYESDWYVQKDKHRYDELYTACRINVKGNIYQNPELLEKTSE